MTIPAFLFGALLCSLVGASYHLVRGGNLGRLVLFIVLSWIGFWAGHFIASSQGWSFATAGPLQVGSGIVLALLLLAAGDWLSQIKIEGKNRK